jgi:eukaryotic-like serine/threonine-protein kinase
MSTPAPATFETPAPSFPTTRRFEPLALLGRGANGIVYRALDRDTGREVALKTLPDADPDQIYHLKAEFRSLASIAHPNLVQLDELVFADDECFFTMELVRGRTFHDLVQDLSAGEGPSGWTAERLARLSDVLEQIVFGLRALHEAGKLHRDIKPSNILVTDDGRAVLVDFGLCTELRLAQRGQIPFAGTLLYMAPEQAWGKPLSAASDWYALGAVIYEALAGAPAFDGSAQRVLFAKENAPERPAGLPEGALPLADLAVALMHPDPAQRPGPESFPAALAGGAPALSSREAPVPAPFVGRAAELEVLEAALADVAEGRPAIVDVEGPAGIGKSQLVERFLAKLEGGLEAVVLRGRCHLQESVPYNGFDGVVDELSEWMMQTPPSALAELLPGDVGALAALFPVLGRVSSIARDEDASWPDPYVKRQRAFRALRELFTNIGQRHTLVVALDDVQWGGADTASLLAEVFRPPQTPRVLLVLAYRTEDESGSTLLTTLRARAGDLLDSVHRVTLGPIDPAASRGLAVALLGARSPESRCIAEQIAEGAGGHPFFLRELAFAAANAGGPSLTAAPNVRALLGDRIAKLAPDDRDVLGLAATAGRPVPRRIVLAASRQGEGGRPGVLRLARQRLLRETVVNGEPAIEPYHSHVREAALAAAPESERRKRHRALADALLEDAEPDADALADHLAAAGEHASAAHYAVVAADRASRALAFDRAVTLYRTALDLGVPNSARVAIRTRLAAALTDAGRGSEAADAYAAAAREARATVPAAAPDLERVAAEHYLRAGNLEEGVHLLRRVLGAAKVTYPRSPLTAFGATVAYRTLLSMRGLRWKARPAAEIDPAELARIDACWSAGLGLSLFDRTRVAAFQARFMILALRAGEPTRVSLALATEASQLAAIGGAKRTARAREILAEALETTGPSGDKRAHAFNLLMAGTIEFYASRWRAGLELYGRAERILEEGRSRSEWELLTAQMLSLASLAYLGELRALRARQRDLVAEAQQRENRLALVCLSCGPANIGWLAAGDPDEAERRIDDALSSWKDDDFQLPHYLHLIAAVQISLYRGDAEAALERISAGWPHVVSSMSLYVQNFRVTLRHLRARAALAVAVSLPPGPRSRLRRARLLRLARSEARRLAADDVAWATPLALAIEAGVASQSGDPRAAGEILARAAGAFRDQGMLLYAAATDYERGRLSADARGRALLADAEAWMVAEHVASPEDLAATLVPGLTPRTRA